MAEDFITVYYYGIYIFSLISLLLASLIYRSTRKATKGWMYLVIYIALNSILPIISLHRTIFLDADIATRSIHGILSIGAGACLLVAAVIFTGDFGVKCHLDLRRALYVYGGFLAVMLLLGATKPLGMQLLTGITYYTLAFSLLLSGIIFLKIFLKTKEVHWSALSISTLLEGGSLFGLAYIQGCCANSPFLAECANLIGTSITPFPQFCITSLTYTYLPLVWTSYIAWFMGLLAYFLVYRFWKKTLS